MKAVSQVETATTVLAKFDLNETESVIIEFTKANSSGIHNSVVSTLSNAQYEALEPLPVDALLLGIIENNRNAFDLAWANEQ